MKHKIIVSLTTRLINEIAPQNPIRFLQKIDTEDLYSWTLSVVYLYTRVSTKKQAILYTEVISAIGHTIRDKSKMKKDSALAAKAGAFALYSFEQVGLLKLTLGTGANGHGTYLVTVLKDEDIARLWGEQPFTRVEKLPSLTPYADWVSSRHETDSYMVKTTNKNVLNALTPQTHPIVFNVINKAQRTGWLVNQEVFGLVNWALRNKTDAFAEIWELQNPEAKQSKIREVHAIASIAKRFLNTVFYHKYYFDFRGRKYAATAYFHEQGSDLAKGLLLRSDSGRIGLAGYKWLLISIASNWGGDAGRDDGFKTDKIPLEDRCKWVLDNEEIILSYAESPKVNQGWMKADKPWQFIAACMELKNLRVWQATKGTSFEDYNYVSHLECFIDGLLKGHR